MITSTASINMNSWASLAASSMKIIGVKKTEVPTIQILTSKTKKNHSLKKEDARRTQTQYPKKHPPTHVKQSSSNYCNNNNCSSNNKRYSSHNLHRFHNSISIKSYLYFIISSSLCFNREWPREWHRECHRELIYLKDWIYPREWLCLRVWPYHRDWLYHPEWLYHRVWLYLRHFNKSPEIGRGDFQ